MLSLARKLQSTSQQQRIQLWLSFGIGLSISLVVGSEFFSHLAAESEWGSWIYFALAVMSLLIAVLFAAGTAAQTVQIVHDEGYAMLQLTNVSNQQLLRMILSRVLSRWTPIIGFLAGL